MEEDLKDAMKTCEVAKAENATMKKKLKRCEEERDSEIVQHNEEYEKLRKKHKACKAEGNAENALLAEKYSNLKETYKAAKQEHDREVELLIRKIEIEKGKQERDL